MIGKITKRLPNQLFEVELASGHKMVAHLGKTMKMKYTRLLPGESVSVELSPYDPQRGKIVALEGSQ